MEPRKSRSDLSGLLEREAELSTLERVANQALKGAGGALVIRGPAGIGKTVLLSSLRIYAHDAGAQVLSARGAQTETNWAYGVVRQLLESSLITAEPGLRKELLRGPTGAAEGLLAGSSEPGQDLPFAGPEASFAVNHGLYWLLANLADRRPVVLLVDDVQLADEASLGFLAFLASRVEGLPVLLALAIRCTDPGADHPLLSLILADPAVHSVSPKPLSRAGVRHLLEEGLERVDTALSAVCLRATAGNPFLVKELLAALAGSSCLPEGSDVQAFCRAVAQDVSASILARLTRSTPQDLGLARAVAVLGSNTCTAHVAVLAGRSPADARKGLDRLVRAQVLDSGPDLRFVHPLVWAAVYDDMPPNERAEAHGKAARLLAEARAGTGRVAGHLLHGNPCGDSWVIGILRAAAAEAVQQGAPQTAVNYLERALAELPEGPELQSIMVDLGTALNAMDNHGRAVSMLSAALALGGKPRERGHIARALGGLLVLKPGTARQGVQIMGEGADELEDTDRELGLALEADIAAAAFISLPARVAGAERAVRFFDPSDRRFRAHAALRHAMYQGPAAESQAVAHAVLEDKDLLARTGADSPTFWEAVLALLFAQDLVGAHALMSEALTQARAVSSAVGVGLASCFRARAGVLMGNLPEAEADGRTYVELLGDRLAVGPAFLVDALTGQGKLDEAEQVLARHEACPERTELAMFHFFLVARAGLRQAQGDYQAALDDLFECSKGLDRWDATDPVFAGMRTPGSIQWRPQAAEALLHLGKRPQARKLVLEELDACRRYGAATTLGGTLRVAGLVEGGERGIGYLQEAVRSLSATPARLEHARALVDLGSQLRRVGCPKQARVPLREGMALARGCGATLLAERAHTELCATGARPRKIVRTGVEALTASERRIADMARTGFSNREIAQALFVTPRTVEAHLHHTYLKLGINSREQLKEVLIHESAGRTVKQTNSLPR